MFVKAIFIALTITTCVSSDFPAIGGLFYANDVDLKTGFTVSANMYNFTPIVKQVSKRGEILEISRHVCELAEEGVVAIIDGLGGKATEHVEAICDMLDIPLIVVHHNDHYVEGWLLLNLYPSPEALNTALVELVNVKEWRNFTILYVKGHSLTKVNQLIKMGSPTDQFTVTIRELSGNDYRDVLISAKRSGFTNFVVDCPSANIEQILMHAQQVGLMADEHSYIFVSLDLFTLDLYRYRYGGVNMTGFRLVVNNDMLYNFVDRFKNESEMLHLETEQIKTEVVFVHDAVLIIYNALSKIEVEARALTCSNEDAWEYGSSLLSFMKTSKVKGATGTLLFDGFGQRNNVVMEVLELTSAGNQTIGKWSNNKLNISRPLIPAAEIAEETIMRNKTFKVLIATKAPPYGYEKASSATLEGNDRYEGFTIDLIEKVADILGFMYEFEVEQAYGGFEPKTGVGTGMVGKLRNDAADFAICDFTITTDRQKGIDFTPFMSLGIGILYKKPSKQPPAMFSFMEVFSQEVWYSMMSVQIGLGVIMIFVGRISNKEWQNPVPCIEQPDELSNQFSFANSVWLIIGSVMQQGTEIAPIALAPRIITSAWWFFTMVMVATYTGTLVAFLTVEKNVLPFQNVDDLRKHSSIHYGAKSPGSTLDFFRDSPEYRSMYDKMMSKKWYVTGNEEGVALAETTAYAFFMESASIEYYTARHCDLIQVGGLLDSKSYGIGMKKGSPYKRYIDEAILKLKERGEIQKLKDLWWKEKKGGGKCEEHPDAQQQQLGMKHMLGAFVVLGVGCAFGLLISILDMLWGVFKRTVKYNTTFKYELIEELKFALKFSGDIKPVRRPSKTDSGSAEQLAELEGKDEIRSLKSVRSGRSTDTHKTHHSHSSRHSSGGLSVAFAKRREYS